MNVADACKALKLKRRVGLVYDGISRVVEIHAVGRSGDGHELLRVYQVRGGSKSGKTPPRLPRTYHGHTTWEIPIRRQFLGALLGYLVCVQILVIVASFGIRFVAPLAVAALPTSWLLVSKAFVVFICVFAFAQVSLGTMIVVHYLGSRLNSPPRAAPQD